MNVVMETGCPRELAKYAGTIIDVDAHEWTPPQLWPEIFGEETRMLSGADAYNVEGMKEFYFKLSNSFIEESDVIDSYTVWNAKGPWHKASYDMGKRLEYMNFIGVDRQVIFPGNLVIVSLMILGRLDDPTFFAGVTGDRRAYAMKMIRLHNDWVIRQAAWSDRLRAVATIVGDTVDDLYNEAKRVIDSGVRAIWLPCSMLPGGKSPAHPDLDRFWSLCADSNTTCTLHVGNEAAFFKTLEWGNAPFFRLPEWNVTGEVQLDPWTLGTWMIPGWNYLVALIGGGVFDRHPKLRFGVQELGGHWIGACGLGMDLWGEFGQTQPWSTRLKMKPSDYIRRNVKVAAFPWEPIDKYIEQYDFEDVYCYSSDFPHVEGGKAPMSDAYKRLERLGEGVIQKYFVDNCKWLAPD